MFMLAIAGVLLLLSFFAPENGFEFAGAKFKLMSADEVFNPEDREVAEIAEIVADVDTAVFEEEVIEEIPDSIKFKPVISYQIDSSTVVHLNPAGRENLQRFFGQMRTDITAGKRVHMLHFGDSQIEGDRMTSFIRQRMQQQFGGTGPGLVPAMNVYNTGTFVQTLSENFQRYTCFGGTELGNKEYGVMNAAARFTPEVLDSADTIVKTAFIELAPSTNTFKRNQQYTSVKMNYSSCTVTCKLTVWADGVKIKSEKLIADSSAHQIRLSFDNTPQSLRFEFESVKSPTIHNFVLEGAAGIYVDNIAMRGSSGTYLHKVDKSLFASQMCQLNTGLIIWQYGGNSVPYLKDSASVENYARYYRGQLKTLMSLNPNAAVVVIGPSDMSTLVNGFYSTYPLLPYCIKLLKKVSMETGAGYWDIYEAMGGKNSMPAWVEKGLAGADYVHFTPKGAKFVSQLFYDAFMAEYAKFVAQ